MTLGDAITRAVAQRDARMAGFVADVLRDRGFSYGEVYTFVNEHTAIALAEWETLMYEADVEG